MEDRISHFTDDALIWASRLPEGSGEMASHVLTDLLVEGPRLLAGGPMAWLNLFLPILLWHFVLWVAHKRTSEATDTD